MPAYAALLRGINVNGQKMIKMDHLRALFESLNFQNVSTYIQSGNVVFKSEEEDAEVLKGVIEKELTRILSFEVPVLLRTKDALEQVVQRNPYKEVIDLESKQLYVTFLTRTPTVDAVIKTASIQSEMDEFRIVDREVYVLCRGSYGKTKFSNAFFEKKLGVTTTTRNWDTINKLIQLTEGGV
ncbi:DUF1697 domain-containing protein [Paenibacillus sp. SYP-B3998]|uniref:DUF1697 domain-containing protein n=1 Tax=Paenibacillus sp. SYP-B3998 TaxID=2678564 RepID=A0A6G3ZX66_9BACL|nr:DUF1697 domain-containing protein [Paenibacillus sp. SYP-B3998]NEW06638.1 DUF1697 domain-containing protein [Paenibacillus sp. SYP-B3998]